MMKLSALEYWKHRFDEPPQTEAEKLAVAMMRDYADYIIPKSEDDVLNQNAIDFILKHDLPPRLLRHVRGKPLWTLRDVLANQEWIRNVGEGTINQLKKAIEKEQKNKEEK